MPLWANYQQLNPPFGTSQQSGFVYVGTTFTAGSATTYTITALTPAVFAASNAGVGQDGLNPLPATSIHTGDTVTITPALGGLTVIPTTLLAGLVRVSG